MNGMGETKKISFSQTEVCDFIKNVLCAVILGNYPKKPAKSRAEFLARGCFIGAPLCMLLQMASTICAGRKIWDGCGTKGILPLAFEII